MSIVVKDMVMGSSKTTNQIKEINRRTTEDLINFPLLVIVPLKDEVERYINECPNEYFKQPRSYYDYEQNRKISKRENILDLLVGGESVVTTHALFDLFTDEIEEEISRQNYRIIIDEEVTTIKPLFMTKDEYKLLFVDSEYARTNHTTGVVEWIGPIHKDFEVDKRLIDLRRTIMSNRVVVFNSTGGYELFVVQTPPNFFNLVDNYVILTYMFDCSDLCIYFDIYEVNYVIERQDAAEVAKYKDKARKLITFIEPPKSVKELSNQRKTHFSSTHWDSNRISVGWMTKLRRTLGESLRRKSVTRDKLLYACKKDLSVQEENTTQGRFLTPRGYKGCWIPYNMKATNNYSNKTFIIYMHNVYRNVHVAKYLNNMLDKRDCNKYNRITKKQNENYSLSVMLQCLWRTAIRNDEPIKVMIFSERMKSLLVDWLKG